MTILVTGGAGYIGSICTEELINNDNKIIILDNLKEGNKSAINQNAIFYKGDYGDKDLLDTIFSNHNIDIVIHFAAEASVPISMKNPSIFFNVNVIEGINLLDKMLEFNCRKIIFSSTAAVYGEPEYTPIDENHKKIPINPYGESKLVFEKILKTYHKSYGLKYNLFRYFNAAGATKRLGEAHKNESHLIPLIFDTALGKRDHIEIFGKDYPTTDGTCVRDYIHVKDIAHAHILAFDNLDKHPNGIYNLGNGKGFSNLEVLETVAKVTDMKINYSFVGRRPGDPAVLVASSRLAQKELGWVPKYSELSYIIKSAWDWLIKNPYKYNSYLE